MITWTRSSRFRCMLKLRARLKSHLANELLCIRGPLPCQRSSSQSSQEIISRSTQRKSVLKGRSLWNKASQHPVRCRVMLNPGVGGRWQEMEGCSLQVSTLRSAMWVVLTDESVWLGGDSRRFTGGREEVYSDGGEIRRTRLPAKVDRSRLDSRGFGSVFVEPRRVLLAGWHSKAYPRGRVERLGLWSRREDTPWMYERPGGSS